MQRLRSFLLLHRRLALCVAVLALAMKVLVPGGFMPERQGGKLVVLLCAGDGPADGHRSVALALPGAGKAGKPGSGSSSGSSNGACPYAALALAGLAPADAGLLAAALAFILLLGMAGVPVARCAAPERLRPPLRGPPGLV